MSKRIGITLIVIALVICIAYAVIGITTFKACPVETTTPSEVKEYECKAELVYSSLMYNSGAYEYSIQASVNVEKLTKNVTVAERLAIVQQSKNAIDSLKQEWENSGYKIETKEDFFVSAIIAYYDDYDQLALANGQTGYDKVENSGKTYHGLLFDKIVSERPSIFKEESGTILNTVEERLNEIDGIEPGDVSLVYNYGTMYKPETISSDANQIYKLNKVDEGLFTIIHEFRMTNDNRGRIITLVQTSPNVYTWYLLPIVCSLLIAGITILVAGAKRS